MGCLAYHGAMSSASIDQDWHSQVALRRRPHGAPKPIRKFDVCIQCQASKLVDLRHNPPGFLAIGDIVDESGILSLPGPQANKTRSICPLLHSGGDSN